jgi:hypothetical protein
LSESVTNPSNFSLLNYRLKKWAARALCVVLMVVAVLAMSAFDPDTTNWASFAVTLFTVGGVFYVYYAFRPSKLLPPADGFRPDTEQVLIYTTEWQESMPADRSGIRAALLTCLPYEFSSVRIQRPDFHVLIAHRNRGGWSFTTGLAGEKTTGVGRRKFPDSELAPVRYTRLKAMFGTSLTGDTFGNLDTEAVLIAFAEDQPDPDFLVWLEVVQS